MILFYKGQQNLFYAVGTSIILEDEDLKKLTWLFGNATLVDKEVLEGNFIGLLKRNDFSLEYQCGRNHTKHGD